MLLPSSSRFFQGTFFILLLGIGIFSGSALLHMSQEALPPPPSPSPKPTSSQIPRFAYAPLTPELQNEKQRPGYWMPNPPAGATSIHIEDLPSHTIEDPNTNESITLSGQAGSVIDEIRIKTQCRKDGWYNWVSIHRPLKDAAYSTEWNWTYTLSAVDRTLCAGHNYVAFAPASAGHEYSTYSINTTFYSTVGYVDPVVQESIDRLTALPEYAPEYIQDDRSMERILFHPILKNADLCLTSPRDHPIFANVLVKDIRLDEHLTVRMRSWNPYDFPGIKNGDYATPIIEFSRSNRQASSLPQVIVPPPLAALSCPYTTLAGAKIYYVRPDRILVDLGYSYESPRVLYVWDGKKWLSLYSIVPTRNPLNLGSLNRKGFEVFETGGCCEQAYPTVPGKWSAMYVDFDTLEVEGVLFSKWPPG